MFKHHKFCVVDVLGLLVARKNTQGALEVFLLDSSAALKDQLIRSSATDANLLERQLQASNQLIQVADPALLTFLRQRASPQQHPAYCYLMEAHITGTLDLDTAGVQFHQVSRAVLQDPRGPLTYQSAT